MLIVSAGCLRLIVQQRTFKSVNHVQYIMPELTRIGNQSIRNALLPFKGVIVFAHFQVAKVLYQIGKAHQNQQHDNGEQRAGHMEA